ncbi:hypothetical protein FD755_000985 [Muntiacus reevesi]|uniref:Ribosomal protein S4e N-terminal domain-containing protein n=1 Tax=Muntiacus reevesi TaxID=9886 RepID=A0A5J5N308_MUNRE|nr:hypothetical protein FD755_000985 [Muntiacus reevesi]
MAHGLKKHLKCVTAPNHWMPDKLTGVFASHPFTGPHELREYLLLVIFLRNRLKYIDGKVWTDITYSADFMDIIGINKTGENFHLLLEKDLCGAKGILHLMTHDVCTISHLESLIKVNDTIQIDLVTGANLERMDMITNCERHPGSFVVHVKDASGNSFDTGFSNIFIIDKGNTMDLSSPWKEYPPYHC